MFLSLFTGDFQPGLKMMPPAGETRASGSNDVRRAVSGRAAQVAEILHNFCIILSFPET